MFKREINRPWGLTAARAWARLPIEHIHILVLGFDDVTESEAQARQRQFNYSRYVRNDYDNGHRPSGRG
jgi:poly-gamma-glutamate capsule biosynthesis protein CapA/YwtB (metallophosphatase superfamily)